MAASHDDRLRSLVARLAGAERSVRVLRTIAWPPSVRERFFARGARELPEVEYTPPPVDASLEAIADLERELGTNPEDAWLRRHARAIATSARMLAAAGTPDFSRYSRDLYGEPSDTSLDGRNSVLDLARHLEQILRRHEGVPLGAPPPACNLATAVADAMRQACGEFFGDQAPVIEIVDELSANALAGPQRIRIRRTGCFTDLDIAQLIHHEAFIHVATSLNGRRQVDLPILAAAHAGTTRTQEGLAVLAELFSGSWDPDRLHRLARRVIAIQKALDGADFLDVYRFFESEGLEPEQAFESARRVFRGGTLDGGSPFTKDGVYLDGLLRVHSFLRCAIANGRADCVELLFCGKLDIDDVAVLGQLRARGLCRPARFLPPWASDLRYLVAFLAFSTFLNRVDLAGVAERYGQLIADTPQLSAKDVKGV